ncbi:MAG: ATP-dependent protease ATPase subunit HslU, partial [Bacillota bacterium]|nr:ATP-dependent protease ATPase subunit HslU [Bacillota bacterium]
PNDGAELRKRFQERLSRGELENHAIDIEVTDRPNPTDMFMGSGMEELGANVSDMLSQFMPKKTKKKRVTVAQARRSLAQEEAEKLLDNEDIASRGVELAEQNGIIFIDEIDKVAMKSGGQGPDVSREGVQRDILPIVEGSTVNTKYGPVRTDFVLFIAAGAFHMSKPSDLIPELQGRFPVRVELKSLRREDLRRILTEPRTSLLKQYQALFSTEGVSLNFTECAAEAIAKAAFAINSQGQDIGARRLHTILERVLEEYSFEAGTVEQAEYTIDGAYVQSKLEPLLGSADLGKYIL